MAKFDSKVDGNTVGGDEYNNIVNPLANLITSSGQTIDTSNTQVVKAIADYAAVGTFYSEGGVVNAYSLSAIGNRLAPNAYSEGMEIRFRAGNANTGAATVNVAGLGVKSIKQGDGSTDLTAGDISTDFDTRARYDGTVFRLSNVSDIGNLTVNGKFNTTATYATIASGAITYSSAYMVVNTEGNASSDDLLTINGGVDGDEVTIRPTSSIKNIIIRDNSNSSSNILLKKNLDVLLDESYDAITLKYRGSDGNWFEVSRSLTVDTRILEDLTVNGKFSTTPVTETISSGAITYSGSTIQLNGEGGAADGLSTINGGSEGDRVLLRKFYSSGVITVEDGTGNIYLEPNENVQLGSLMAAVELSYINGTWKQVSRSGQLDFKYGDTSNGYQYLPSGFIMQWGIVTVGNNATVTVTLPITYTNNNRGAYASLNTVEDRGEPVQATVLSNSQIRVRNSNINTDGIRWLCIGF